MSTEEWTAIILSLKIAGVAVIVSLPLAVFFAWLFARNNFLGKSLVETIVYLPLVLPPVVTGYLLLIVFGRRGFIGSPLDSLFDVQIVFDWKGAAIASAIVSFPLLVRSIRIAFTSVDPKLEEAAMTLGASKLRIFSSITLPLAWHGIVAGSVLAFARSLGEFGATIMIAGNIFGETQTIPLYVYNELQNPGGLGNAAGVIAFSIFISFLAILSGQWLERRGHTRFG